ncbi:MAG: porin [Bacteroidetes bacterium]|jgi:phosphate-selective porin OprO/OprP|nr:porin [Bacteroidota bacterium]
MKQIAVLLCALLFVAGPRVALGQSEGGSEEGLKTPLGVEARAGKLVFESKDGSMKWWFDSRLQIDFAKYFENKNKLSDGSMIRRATFALKATLWNDWQAEVDFDFAENVLDARDMWIKYTVPDMGLAVQVGNFKEPFGMERLNSSRLLTFLERASASNAFALGRRMGIAARYWNEYGQATVGAFGHEIGTRIDKGQRDEGYSFNGRLTAAPINEHGLNVHIGGAASYKIPDALADLSENTIEVNARTESYVFDPKFLHSGDIKDVNYYTRYGAELAGIYGPFYLQSEFMMMQVKRWYGKPTVDMEGGYLTLSWMATGETRAYYVDEGEVGPIEPPKNSWGALELAVRGSYTNLNDFEAGVKGGMSHQLMCGINYYPNVNIKIQFNYSMVNLDANATRKGNLLGDDDHSFFQMRFQASI